MRVPKVKATTTNYFSSPPDNEKLLQRSTIAIKKTIKHDDKFRIVPPLASAYRPLSGSGTTRHKKGLRPKEEPVSPVMSGFGVSGPLKSKCTTDR
jgi:hypothetical protein